MMFKTSTAFREGFFAAGDPILLMNPYHYLRLWVDQDYADGVEYACYAYFNQTKMPYYAERRPL